MLGRLFNITWLLSPCNLYHLQKLCGLPINTYFSAVKLRWLIDHCEAVRKAIDEERCLFGTVDSWLIWVKSFYMLFQRIFNTQDWSFLPALLLSPSGIHLQIPLKYSPTMCMLWFKIFLGLNFIVFCFVMIRYHTQKQKKIKFEPRIKLNHNVYVTGQITFRLKFFNLGWFSISKLYPSPNWWARRQKKLRINLG